MHQQVGSRCIVSIHGLSHPRISLNLITTFARFIKDNGNVARLLAESHGYRLRLIVVKLVCSLVRVSN